MEIYVNRKWKNGEVHVSVTSASSGIVDVAVKNSEI
jgi:hypothetical protein